MSVGTSKSGSVTGSPPSSSKAKWDDEHFKDTEACKGEVDRLAEWILQHCGEMIQNESAVDFSIRIMTDWLMKEKAEPIVNSDVMVVLRDLRQMLKRLEAESGAHHIHGDIGCNFFWRRRVEMDRLIQNFEKELPK